MIIFESILTTFEAKGNRQKDARKMLVKVTKG
jgi:hypothetical protein